MATSVPETIWDTKKARSVCWTLNNYQPADIAMLRQYAAEGEIKYMVFGYETAPTTGTPHLQAYTAWTNPRSIGKFMRMFITKGIHIEKTRGTPAQASDYCKYSDYPHNTIKNEFEEFGTLPAQGERTDWTAALTAITQGEDITEVIEAQPHLLPCIRSLERFKVMKLKPLHRDVRVIVLHGEAGTGKTRYAYDTYADIYSKPRGDWWDGYSGQKTILLDDYYGYLPYCELLRVLDRYPYQVPVKGGYVYAQWDTVIITSNKEPQHWYSNGLTPALRRRLNEIILVTSIDGQTLYSPPPRSQAQDSAQAESL